MIIHSKALLIAFFSFAILPLSGAAESDELPLGNNLGSLKRAIGGMIDCLEEMDDIADAKAFILQFAVPAELVESLKEDKSRFDRIAASFLSKKSERMLKVLKAVEKEDPVVSKDGINYQYYVPEKLSDQIPIKTITLYWHSGGENFYVRNDR